MPRKRLLTAPFLVLLIASCSSPNDSEWVVPYFNQHRAEFLQLRSFVDSCDGFKYADGLGEYYPAGVEIYMDPDAYAGGCKDGSRPETISPKLREIGVYWAVNDVLRHSSIMFATKSPGLFGYYGAIYYNATGKTVPEIKVQDGTPLEEPCPCHWYYLPSS